MLYGVRPDEQQRLASEGARVRVYVPYGSDWYGYLMRRLAERPANVRFFLRALARGRGSAGAECVRIAHRSAAISIVGTSR